MPPRRWHMLGLIFLPAFFCLESCGLKDRAQPDTTSIVVRIGEKGYSKTDLEHFFDSRLNELRDSEAAADVKSALLEAFIEEKLLLQKAEDAKTELDPKSLEEMRSKLQSNGSASDADAKKDRGLDQSVLDTLKVQAYLNKQIFKDLAVSQAECEAYYKERIQDYVRNDVVHVREILVDTIERAQKIQDLLKANHNRNFKELARQYSKAPTALEGGDLGSFQRGELPEALEKAIFPLAPGTISRIVSTQYGYHTFYLEEKIPAHQQKFSEVGDQIQEKLLLVRQREALAKELGKLAGQIKIKVERDKLDFKYTGSKFAPTGGVSQ
jgi:parvulin-like peptidyl-prolyl isomerase